MAAKKTTVSQEPLLNTMARKLGHAAGALTKVTHELTENLSAFPESVTAKVRGTAGIGELSEQSRVPSRHPKKRNRRSPRTLTPKRAARVAKRKKK